MIKNPVSKIFSPFAKPHMIKSTKMDPGPCVETLIKHQSTDIENRVIVTHVLLIESPLYWKPIVLKAHRVESPWHWVFDNDVNLLGYCIDGSACIDSYCEGFVCPSLECIPLDLVCDGVSDCDEGKDEELGVHCPSTKPSTASMFCKKH